jgi:translation elongation factor EF-4
MTIVTAQSPGQEVGGSHPEMIKRDSLAGDVGYIVTDEHARRRRNKLDDTITHSNAPCETMLPGYKQVSPMVSVLPD